MSRPITFCTTSQSLFAHAAFWWFSKSKNGLTLTSDQAKKSEMDVSNDLKRKKQFSAEEARRILLDISDSASSGDYTLKQSKKSHNNLKYKIKQINTN